MTCAQSGLRVEPRAVSSTFGRGECVAQSGSQHPAGLREGDILAGKYRVERVLGVGGMGVVVAAHHLHLDERVAIKFLLPEMLDHAESVGRFAREARAAVKIKSEHVARVLDVGTLDTGAPYMVMEYLDGQDLGTWIKQRGPLPIDQAVEFLIQACVAIAEAHGLGIVHRDIKPSNLFCVRGADGRLVIKVLDFGISKMTSFNALGPSIATRTSAIMGSPLYMSPEQMKSAKDADARADIWALGIVLYELLTGRVPFVGETVAEIIVKIATEAPEPLRTFRPHIAEGLETAFRRCTAKDRERRYRNVGELAVALLPYAPPSSRGAVEKTAAIVQSAGLSPRAVSEPPSALAAQTQAAPTTEAGLGHTARPSIRGRGRVVAAIAGASALVIALGAGWRISRPGQGSEAPAVAPASSTPAVATVSPGAVVPTHEGLVAPSEPDRLTEAPAESPVGSAAIHPSPSGVSRLTGPPKSAGTPHGTASTSSREPAAPASAAAPQPASPPPIRANQGPSNPSIADPLSALRPK
jgi:eukaryotic-like serine/threonine-protein kinase